MELVTHESEWLLSQAPADAGPSFVHVCTGILGRFPFLAGVGLRACPQTH
jgi:hypothetical protein